MDIHGTTVPDEDLPIAAAATGDEESFAILVRRMAPLIRSQVGFFRGAGPDEEDLVQEALLGLLSAVRTFRTDGGASFSTYASTCIRHRLISAIRHHGVQTNMEQPWEDEDELPPSPVGDPVDLLQEREDATRLLSRYKKQCTDLEYQVLLACLSGCSYKEISLSLGITVKSVDNAIQRLRRKLSAEL